jgi:type II secretory pathway pseudopilin PulG
VKTNRKAVQPSGLGGLSLIGEPRPSSLSQSALIGRRRAGFSLIEIMVTMGMLTFIVLGLLLMFNQTQRAFRTGLTQTDVLESGRATLDMVARDLEQMAPSEAPDYINQNIRYRTTNFFVEPAVVYLRDPTKVFSWKNPFLQELPGNIQARTNLVQRFFFLSKLNQDWLGTGYTVIPDDANGCVGTLYRYSATNNPRGALVALSTQFPLAYTTNMSRIADGIVHLRLRAFARNGYLITTNFINGTNASYPLRSSTGPYTNIPNAVLYGSGAYNSSADPRQAACYFMNNALPGYLELELGVLEPQILQKYRSIDSGLAARQYLSNHVAQVHIFRQRIPVRNLDLSAYQ